MKRTSILIVAVCILALGSGSAQEPKPIQLPPPQTDIGKPLMQAFKLRQSTRSFDSKSLPLQELSNLLWAADGINRPESGKRTAPSAMNWQEVDIYVALPEAAYVYEPKTHSLMPVVNQDVRAATGRQSFVKYAPLNLVYVSDLSKVKGASEDDQKIWDGVAVGCIVQNVYLYCASQGLVTVVRGMVDRPPLAELLKLRPDQRVMVAQTVGFPKDQ
jgi:nitroreductase